MLSRRDFLTQGVAVAAPQWLVPDQNTQFWEQPRMIDLQRLDTSERFQIMYWQNGALDKSGYQKACEVLRDNHVQEIYPMDVRLLDLICATQAWIRFYGYQVPYIVHSAYRSPKTNRRIEGAARDSKHMTGQALDFRAPGVPPEYMGRLAHVFLKTDGQGGGVGFYNSQRFTHMDTSRGRERIWIKK